MATLAVPVLEGLAEWLLPRLGIALGGALLADKVLEKDKTKEDAPAIPDTATRTRTRTCKQCPPDCGSLVTRNWNMSDVSRAYQARVTGFAPYTEWNFAGNDFDGFRSTICQLEEAKAKYDQFFDEETGEPRRFYRLFGVPKMLGQAQTHNGVVISNPPAKVLWYFMQPLSYGYFSRTFRIGAPFVVTALQP